MRRVRQAGLGRESTIGGNSTEGGATIAAADAQ